MRGGKNLLEFFFFLFLKFHHYIRFIVERAFDVRRLFLLLLKYWIQIFPK